MSYTCCLNLTCLCPSYTHTHTLIHLLVVCTQNESFVNLACKKIETGGNVRQLKSSNLVAVAKALAEMRFESVSVWMCVCVPLLLCVSLGWCVCSVCTCVCVCVKVCMCWGPKSVPLLTYMNHIQACLYYTCC